MVLASGSQRNIKVNARRVTLIILNCPTDERLGSLDQNCCLNPLLPTESNYGKLNPSHESTAESSGLQPGSLLKEQLLGAGRE